MTTLSRSMTGFGKAECQDEKYEINAEVRSLNNRYLDINLKLPKTLANFELSLKDRIKKKIIRGKVSVVVSHKTTNLESSAFTVNEEMIRFYHRILEQIKNKLGLKDPITLNHLLHFRELIEPEETAENTEPELEAQLYSVIDKAMDELNAMREKEAANICEDLFQRIDKIRVSLRQIIADSKDTPRRELEKLSERLKELVENNEIDRERLEHELALIADRVDITEECTRLASHLDLFTETLRTKQEVGKQLTFILQEMHREVNTIGSKTTEVGVSHAVIRIKEEIEKLREQTQNLE